MPACPASFFKERLPTNGNDGQPLKQSLLNNDKAIFNGLILLLS